MDRMIYVAMTGAKHTLEQQAVVANNLANIATNGYRAAASAFRAVPVQGEGMPTRAFVVGTTAGANFASGPLQGTGRELDIALQGPGWIAVQTANGKEAYTRNGMALGCRKCWCGGRFFSKVGMAKWIVGKC